jgi:hypothetical protein
MGCGGADAFIAIPLLSIDFAMARRQMTRRQRAATAGQRPAPRPRETTPRPAEAVAQPRPGVVRILGRHLLWFLPLYAGLVTAAYLLRTFYARGFQDPRLMMGALAAAALGLLVEYPWARRVDRWEARGPAPGIWSWRGLVR